MPCTRHALLAAIALSLGGVGALAPAAVARRDMFKGAASALAGASALVLAPHGARADDAVLEVPPATTKMGGLLDKFGDVNRGFRIYKPSTWNQFENGDGYDFRWTDIVDKRDVITLSTSAYSGDRISDLAGVDRLGEKLAKSHGDVVAGRARTSDGILFYDYIFKGETAYELLTMCVNKSRLWQLSARTPAASWEKREGLLRNVVGSFVPRL